MFFMGWEGKVERSPLEGNFTDCTEKMNSLYLEVLERGKDLYIYGCNPTYVVALNKKDRKEDERGLILDFEDVEELHKMFPICSHARYVDASITIKDKRLRPYTGKEHYHAAEKPIDVSDLETILEKGVILVYSDLV